jgi:hypothetical protein
MAQDMDQSIRDNAEGPLRVRGDSGEMQQHSLRDQIEADRYLANKQAASARGLGLRVSKLVPPGAS